MTSSGNFPRPLRPYYYHVPFKQSYTCWRFDIIDRDMSATFLNPFKYSLFLVHNLRLPYLYDWTKRNILSFIILETRLFDYFTKRIARRLIMLRNSGLLDEKPVDCVIITCANYASI